MSEPSAAPQRELRLFQRILYATGEMGVTLSPSIIVGWLLYFYTGQTDAAGNKVYLVGYGAFAAINFIGRLVDSVADPFVGYMSDRHNTRWGRRIPWVFFGAPFLTLFSILLWYPPADPGAWQNIAWLIFGLSGFWFFYTAVVAPYLSLLPEITMHNEERIETSTYMGYFDVAGMLIATVAIGFFIERFSNGVKIGPIQFPDGYKFAAYLFGIAMMLCFWLSILKVREKPHSAAKEVPYKFWEAFGHCLSNPAFLPYVVSVSFFRVAIDMLVAIIPFMVTVVIGYGEAAAGILQGAITLLSLPLFVLVYKLSAKHGKKKIYLLSQLMFALMLPLLVSMKAFPVFGWLGNWIVVNLGYPALSESVIILTHVSILFLFATFPIATIFVLPRALFADIVDLDASRTGYRREAMYNGMEGLITKFAAGLATVIAPMMLKYFGDTPDHPGGIILIGPVAGVLLFAGWVAFKYYPIEK